MSKGLNTLRKIAATQADQAPPAGDRDPIDRPILASDGVLDRVWLFVKNTFTKKSIDDQLKEDKAVLAAAFEDPFIEKCDAVSDWLTSADIAGGTVIDAETGEEIEIEAGDVQWQQQIAPQEVVVGSDKEKKLNAAARKLMPEVTRLTLKDLGDDPAMLDALVKDLGPEKIKRWFDVKLVRTPLTGDQLRELYYKNAAGRKTVESIIAAGGLKMTGFAKVMRDPRADRSKS